MPIMSARHILNLLQRRIAKNKAVRNKQGQFSNIGIGWHKIYNVLKISGLITTKIISLTAEYLLPFERIKLMRNKLQFYSFLLFI